MFGISGVSHALITKKYVNVNRNFKKFIKIQLFKQRYTAEIDPFKTKRMRYARVFPTLLSVINGSQFVSEDVKGFLKQRWL